VAGNDPGEDEETERVVAGVGVAHVLEEFGSLRVSVRACSFGEIRLLTGKMMSTKSMMVKMTMPTRMWK
jgi:hypothetical protein